MSFLIFFRVAMFWHRCTAAAAVFAVVLGSAQAFKGSTSIRHVRAAPTVVCSLQPQAVSRRHAGLELRMQPATARQPRPVVIDTTGLKAFGAGEW